MSESNDHDSMPEVVDDSEKEKVKNTKKKDKKKNKSKGNKDFEMEPLETIDLNEENIRKLNKKERHDPELGNYTPISITEKDSINDSDEIHVDVKGLTNNQINQYKKIKKMIKLTRAYSLFYYSKGNKWKWVYWTSSIIAIILTAINTIINLIYDGCSDDDTVKNYNVISNSFITAGFATITLLNASVRRKNFEFAGDDYNSLSTAIYRAVFTTNVPINEAYLAKVIDQFSMRMDDYAKMYNEPPYEAIDGILRSKRFGIAIKFKSNKSI